MFPRLSMVRRFPSTMDAPPEVNTRAVLQFTFNSPMACTLSRQKRATGFRPTVRTRQGRRAVLGGYDHRHEAAARSHAQGKSGAARFAFGHSLDRRSHKRTSRTGAVCSKAPIFLGTFGVFTGRSAMRAKAGKDNARILRITWPR
jgi:hypothetical protein